MTATAWSRRYLAYCRAHKIDLGAPVEVPAASVRDWIEGQRSEWLNSTSESDFHRGFDAWLDDRFPEPAEAMA